MILINLLPHREMARQKARQVFNVALVAAAVFGAVIAGGVYLWLQGQIDQQDRRNAFLTAEIKGLDDQIKEVAALEEEIAALKARQEAVEDLHRDQAGEPVCPDAWRVAIERTCFRFASQPQSQQRVGYAPRLDRNCGVQHGADGT